MVDPGEAAPVLQAVGGRPDPDRDPAHPPPPRSYRRRAANCSIASTFPATRRSTTASPAPHTASARATGSGSMRSTWSSTYGSPGHTLSHVAFHGGGFLFCGDTLFSLGCGRMFEGTPGQMLASLDRLAALPGDTLVCCGHEYTQSNGRFAVAAEPENPSCATCAWPKWPSCARAACPAFPAVWRASAPAILSFASTSPGSSARSARTESPATTEGSIRGPARLEGSVRRMNSQPASVFLIASLAMLSACQQGVRPNLEASEPIALEWDGTAARMEQLPPADNPTPIGGFPSAPANGHGDDVFNRIKRNLSTQTCSADSNSKRWRKRYASDPVAFANHLERILPLSILSAAKSSARGFQPNSCSSPWSRAGTSPMPSARAARPECGR